MSEDTVTPENLERLTIEMDGGEPQPPTSQPAPTAPDAVEGQPPTEGEQNPAQTAPVEGQAAKLDLTDEERALLNEIRSTTSLEGTNFKSIPELAKGYRNLQAQFTQDRQVLSKHKPLLERLNNPEVEQFINQAIALIDNPELRQAYMGQIPHGDPRPDPANFGDLYVPENRQRYDTALESWMSRQVDSRLNARLVGIEQKLMMDKYRTEFRVKYPDINEDPDNFLGWLQSVRNTLNPYELAFRVKNWDNAIGQAEAKARKEVARQVDDAAKNNTPKGTPQKQEVSATEVLQYMAKYGRTSAVKRYTAPVVTQVEIEMTNTAEAY